MRDKLRGLRQSKDLGNYINDFRIILNQISEISEYDQITYFTQGLSELTENYVRLRYPESLQKAIEYAEDYNRFNTSHHPRNADILMINRKNFGNKFSKLGEIQKNFTSNELLRHFTYFKGEKIETVFDTGATISLISLSVAKKLNLHIIPSHQKINTADGNTHEVLGLVGLNKQKPLLTLLEDSFLYREKEYV
ncbi:hypothetical protein BpHYR1_018893 [Brachionus plicatilis]|uniref:Uncharacterized protein n=1 Tax=Brachionus plicatilis TaxID=10195 RepID=A0A3M7R1B9_BRAPC|nr:hypothetical protein BpHYR1_018893 [Brachionus plicatilis]